MKNMGVWALKRYGVNHILQTNRTESFNFLVKRRFIKHRGYGEEEVINGSSEIVRLRLLRCKKAKHGVGEKWLLRDHLRGYYQLEDDKSELFDLDTDLLEEKKDLIEVESRVYYLQNIYGIHNVCNIYKMCTMYTKIVIISRF